MSLKVKWKTSVKSRKTFWIFLILIILVFVLWEWNGQVQVETEQQWTPVNQEVETAVNVDLTVDPSRNSGPINVNLAGKEELTRLPGIGPAKAEAILTYREEHGQFEKIEDLDQVPGIGPATLEQMKDMILLEDPATEE